MKFLKRFFQGIFGEAEQNALEIVHCVHRCFCGKRFTVSMRRGDLGKPQRGICPHCDRVCQVDTTSGEIWA